MGGWKYNGFFSHGGDCTCYDCDHEAAVKAARDSNDRVASALSADRARIAAAIREEIDRGRGIINRDGVADLLRVVEGG